MKQKYKIFISLSIVLAGLSFFLYSRIIFSASGGSMYTELNSSASIGSRVFKLTSWVYCPAQSLMEIEVDIEDMSYNGRDVYKVSTFERGGKTYETKIAAVCPTLMVLQVEEIEDGFNDIKVEICMLNEDGSESDSIYFYTNSNNIARTDSIDSHSDTDEYYIARFDRYIAQYKTMINQMYDEIRQKEEQINNNNKLIGIYQHNKDFTAADEQKSLEQQINTLLNINKDLESDIKSTQGRISEFNLKIEDYEYLKDIHRGIY